MKQCDNSTRKIHISNNFILSISLLTMFWHLMCCTVAVRSRYATDSPRVSSFVPRTSHFTPVGPDLQIAPPIGETKPFVACPSISVYVVKLNASISGRHWQICRNVALNRRDFPLLYLIRSVSLRFVLIKYHFFNTGFTLLCINHFPLPACLAACLPRNHPPSHFSLVSRNVICQVHIKYFLICYHYITHILFLYHIHFPL